MDTRPASHPPADVLLALGSGKLDDATAEAIFSHVEVCPECLKTAGRQSGDSFLDKLRAARGASGTPAPNKDLSTFPSAGNTASIPTTSEIPSLTILPELRDHPQYTVLRELGRGGMGVVYLAKNKLMDRKEVLKVVNKQLIGDAGATERFLREIRSAAQLIHPNIVTAFSALQVGELLLFSMEYIEGRDLAEVVKSRGPLPAIHAGSYVLQAARGLQHAFEKGMIHRDIKPQNLILDGKKNIVKILDFGLAKATRTTIGEAAEGLTGMNMMMGTPDYMAPEQARDAANVDIRADIYSLGCTLYCLLAGRAPFVGGSLATKIAAHQLSEPEPIESLRKDLPPDLAEIVRKMMAKDPAQRYQKPEEVVQALTICFKGKGKQPTAKGSPVKVVTAKPVVASKLSAKGEGKSIYEQKTVAPIAAPRQTMKERPAPVAQVKNEKPRLWRKKWLMAAGGAAVALMLASLIGLWAAGVFKLKTADGILVVQVNEPNAEVFVDGDRMTVSWDNGGTKAEIHVKPGTRKVEVKKDGFSTAGKELTFKDGDREIFAARLLPDAPRMATTDAASEKPLPIPDALPDKTPPPKIKKPNFPPTAAADGFVPLFNGKDLAGWVVDSGDEKAWQVKSGELVAYAADDGSVLDQGYLLTKRDFADFRLRFQFQRGSDGAASGIALRAARHETARNSNPEGRSDVPFHLTVWLGKYLGNEGTGALWWSPSTKTQGPLLVDHLAEIKPIGEWNDMEIEMRGPALRITVNGREVQNVMLNKTRPEKNPAPGLSRYSGRVGFLKHKGEVRYRNIEIMELPKGDAAAPPAQDEGFVALFNGKNLTGWKTHPSQPGNWRVEKGVLIGSGPAESYLYSERGDYKDFHLRGEARINDGGNSGLFFRTPFGPGRPANKPRIPQGYEAQINSIHSDSHKTGSLFVDSEGAVVTVKDSPVPAGEWFTEEVVAEGNHIVIKVNGKTTADYTDDKRLFTSGYLALQQLNAQTVAEFRKIEIKELTALPSFSRASDSLPLEAKETAKAFDKSREDARATLLADFDTVVDRLEKMNGSTEQRLKLIDVVKEEKKRFENSGLIPWSEPMRPYLAKYFAATSAAEDKLRHVYNSLIDAQLKAKNESMVADLQADLSNLLNVRVVARWREFMDGKVVGTHSLYSNGRIDNIRKATWIYAQGALIQRWPNYPGAPGGVLIDTFKVSADGTTSAGTNNGPVRTKLTGVYLKGD